MLWLVLGMTIAVILAVFVVGVVAIPARRTGRYVLTERGEKVFRVADERAHAARTLAQRRLRRQDAEATADAPSSSGRPEPVAPADEADAASEATGRFGRLRKRRGKGATPAPESKD